MRKFRRSSKDSRRRVVVLGGVLLLTLIWAQSEMRPGASGSKSDAAAARGTASAATTPGAASTVVDQATPEGWGTDPFDPRPLGSNPVTTGR